LEKYPSDAGNDAPDEGETHISSRPYAGLISMRMPMRLCMMIRGGAAIPASAGPEEDIAFVEVAFCAQLEAKTRKRKTLIGLIFMV
jgi:hypothetical protein